VDQASRLASAGELIEARRDYQTASTWLDVLRRHQLFGSPEESLATATKQALAQLDERIKSEGTVAFEKGKTSFTYRRFAEAIPFLDRAYKLLPDADPRRAQVKEWLDASKAK
jgi:hypothetical protein